MLLVYKVARLKHAKGRATLRKFHFYWTGKNGWHERSEGGNLCQSRETILQQRRRPQTQSITHLSSLPRRINNHPHWGLVHSWPQAAFTTMRQSSSGQARSTDQPSDINGFVDNPYKAKHLSSPPDCWVRWRLFKVSKPSVIDLDCNFLRQLWSGELATLTDIHFSHQH